MRCYLSGAMDRVKDFGAGWREDISPFLLEKGVIVLNPCNKPISIANEIEYRNNREIIRENENYAILSEKMKEIRIIDLRMVDMSDFMIARIDVNIHACGTYEEIGWANRMKKPILIWCLQGKKKLPDWLWGMVPHQHVFGCEESLKDYLSHVHSDEKVDSLKRWIFFDFSQLLPIETIEEN